MFNNCESLNDISELKYLDISESKDFSYMLNTLIPLSGIKDLENCNVSNPNDFEYMFSECPLLSNIKPLEKCDVSNCNDNNIHNFMNLGVRIDLLFIKNKIKDIQVNDKINDYIHFEHINLDLKEKVFYLTKYINDILKKYKNNFFPSENIGDPQENINYRLWLYIPFKEKPKTIEQFLKSQIINLRNKNILYCKNNLIDWTKFQSIYEYKFQIIPLSFFYNNSIKDIISNKYIQYFDYTNEFGKLKFEEENYFPMLTIIIEESPFFSLMRTLYIVLDCVQNADIKRLLVMLANAKIVFCV